MPGFLNSPFVRALVVSVVAAAGSRAAVSSVGGYLVIDNEVGANFSAAGTTGGDYGVAVFGEGTWGNYRHYGNLGLTTTGSWSWGTGNPGDVALADARYEVYVSWRSAAQANLNAGIYSGTDGFSTISINQEPGSLSYTGSLGVVVLNDGAYDVPFVHIGDVDVTDGTFTLTVVDDALDGDYIFLDAAALRAVPEPGGAWIPAAAGVWFAFRRRRGGAL